MSITMQKKPENQKDLPLDIVYEILVHLPVKTLSKFRSVCKPWNSLISYPPFQHDHYRRCQHNPLLLCAQREDGYRGISTYRNCKEGLTLVNEFSITDPGYKPEISVYYKFPSCLGLICMPSVYDSIGLICNPSTGERIALPPIEGIIRRCFGFGYAASTKEFKVVMFYENESKSCCKVFTLSTGYWREARSPPQSRRIWLCVAPFLQGALHLLHRENNDHSISAFDIETEEYISISVPEYYCNSRIHLGTLSELGDKLSLVGKRGNFLELWLLNDYLRVEWVKEYNIDLFLVSPSKNIPEPHHCIYVATPLEILGDGSLTLALYGHMSNELLCYNPKDNIVTQKMDNGFCAWGLFVESFRSLGSRATWS